jgi:parvulin-like peptidyl-prolyl isomerase
MKKSLLKLALITGLSTAAMAQTLAVVNGQNVELKDVNAYVLNITQGKYTYATIPGQFKRQILDRYIGEKVITYQMAEKDDIENRKEYKNLLEVTKKEVAVTAWFDYKINSMKVSPIEVKDAYEKYKDQMFKTKAAVRARHILVKTKQEAEDIINILKATPQIDLKNKFIELAKTKSIGPSKVNGGDLGKFTADKMLKPFSDAAFSLKVEEFTKEPVQTKYGWHVIYVEEKVEEGYKTFDEVKDSLEKRLKIQKLGTEIQALKQKAKIEYK